MFVERETELNSHTNSLTCSNSLYYYVEFRNGKTVLRSDIYSLEMQCTYCEMKWTGLQAICLQRVAWAPLVKLCSDMKKKKKCKTKKRLLQDLNLRGNLPIHFECITLTTRSNSRRLWSCLAGIKLRIHTCRNIIKFTSDCRSMTLFSTWHLAPQLKFTMWSYCDRHSSRQPSP